MRNHLRTERQSSRRTVSTGMAVSSEKQGHAQGLKIPVACVRFTPWALTEAGITLPLHLSVLPVYCRSAESQSRNSPPDECVCLGRFARARCRMRLLERIASWVEMDGACWMWLAGLSGDGYGLVQVAGASRRAHRELYELLRGPIAAGLETDHLCERRACVNPWHLEPVTHAENVRRMNRERPQVASPFRPTSETALTLRPGATYPDGVGRQ